MEDVVSQEKLLKNYIKEGKKELAVKLLFELIVKHARANHFSKADILREKLFEVDSMALTEIVKSAEINMRARKSGLNIEILIQSLIVTFHHRTGNTPF